MCDKNCSTTSCPFAFTEESEQIQGYGCLPTPIEIVSMRVFHGKTWACHSNPEKACIGGLKAVREFGFDNTIIDTILIDESSVTSELTHFSNEQYKYLSDSRWENIKLKMEKD